MKVDKKLTRKEVAILIQAVTGVEVSVNQVVSNEKRWGLDKARGVDLNKRTIRYCRLKVLKALGDRGFLESGTDSSRFKAKHSRG